MDLHLKPHQQTALEQLKSGSILWGGVGTGKTRVALAYYVLHESPKNIVVITTAKKRDTLDWVGEAAHYVIGTTEDATAHGVIFIDSWNNIEKYSEMENCFFIFDEQRLVGSGVWVKAFLKISKHNHWLMLSATPGDTWMDYIPVFIANGFYKNRTEFKREHVIYAPYSKFPKVDRYVGTKKLERLRGEILVHMPYMKETIRHTQIVKCEYDKALMDTVIKERWNHYEQRPIRDVAELCLVMRRVVNENPTRLEAIRAILRKSPKLIVFYNFNYELDLLRGLKTDGLEVAEWNGQKHEDLPRFSDSWIYLVQFVAGSEGWECTETDSTVLYSLTYSYKNWEQSFGRIDRMNSPFQHLYFYVLKSVGKIDQAIWRTLKSKKSFYPGNFDARELETGG